MFCVFFFFILFSLSLNLYSCLKHPRDFPGAQWLKLCNHCRAHGFSLWSGNHDPACHVVQPENKPLYFG